MFPIFLRLDGKDVLVVGGGAVAARKIADLAAAGAKVRVVAKAVLPEIEAHATSIDRRAFIDDDVDGAWLVVAATNDAQVQARIAEVTNKAHIFAIAIDDPPNATAYSASTFTRAPFTIAISSRGQAPALSRLLREVLEQVLPDESWVEAATTLRDRWRREGVPMESRFPELVKAFAERARR